MMTRSGVGHNHADDDINKSENEMKIGREKGAVDSAFLESDAWNIATYELVPDLQTSLLVTMSHKVWDGGEDGIGKKDGRSQMSVTGW